MREITSSDAHILSEMHVQCFAEGWSEADFSQMLSTGMYFGFIADEGFVLGRAIFDEVEIFAICVLPEYRNRRIASDLLRLFNEKSRELNAIKIFLEVDVDNVIAQKLYLSNGYEKISERHNYYGKNSAVIMCYNLTKN